MVDLTGNFQDKAESSAQAALKRQRDFDDLNHEISGQETGRNSRFLNGQNKKSGIYSKNTSEQFAETLEWLLLNNPQYRLAHENLMDALRDAQHKTQDVLERVLAELSQERILMDEYLSSAAKLPDGTIVFKDKEGKVRNENGEIVPDELAASIRWRGDEPSYEVYAASKNRIEELEAAEAELCGIETDLGEIHERNTRNNDPLSIEEKHADTDFANSLKERVEAIDVNLFNHAPLEAKKEINQAADQFTADSPLNEKMPEITLNSKP